MGSIIEILSITLLSHIVIKIKKEFQCSDIKELVCSKRIVGNHVCYSTGAGFCALVGKNYKCKKPSFYHLLSSRIFFARSLRTKYHFCWPTQLAWWKTCYDHIVKLIENGNSFTNIQHFLEGMFVDTFERRRLSYPPGSVPDIDKSASYVPSDEMCKTIFHYPTRYE